MFIFSKIRLTAQRSHLISKGFATAFLGLGMIMPLQVSAQITDAGVYPPDTSGTYAYNSFSPGAPGFPNVGGAYIDPVFGTTIRRLTDQTGSINEDDIYAHHWSNADGTYAFTFGVDIIDVATGNRVYTRQPTGLAHYENYWDANDPDKYYYLEGPNLMRRNLSEQTSTIIKTFPATLQGNGGSLNMQSADGRYFIVRYNGTNKIWDSQTDTIYSGEVTPVSTEGWTSITPDGNYIVDASSQHISYAIDHATQSISSTGVMFWNLCGDHGVLVSSSNGNNYFVGFECHSEGAVYRVDITIDQSGQTPAQQRASNQKIFDLTWDDAGHLSAVSKGPLADWAFIAVEAIGTDSFNQAPTNWTPYKQEIVAMNVRTLEVRRLAHHRSRSIETNYYYMPRISTSWDGSTVMWASNYNVAQPFGYADIYAIRFPLDSTTAVRPQPPTDLQAAP